MIDNVLVEDCDGIKVFDEIESRRKDKTPIIAISNKLVDNEREFLRDYGFDEYFSKPLNDEKMQSIINNYI
jgi:DNA-binding response OmpR family regulator